jgi:hypothetical protein
MVGGKNRAYILCNEFVIPVGFPSGFGKRVVGHMALEISGPRDVENPKLHDLD